MPEIAAGTPPQYFYLLKIRAPNKPPSALFSDFVLFYGLFRITELALPIMYRNLSFLGLILFCTIICIFSDYVPAGVGSRFSLYIGTGAGAGFYSDFVFILFILGNMIQKSLFVYYCRKKV